MGWQDERLTAKEREVLGKIADDLRPDLRPLLDDVLGQRLLEDNELAALVLGGLRLSRPRPTAPARIQRAAVRAAARLDGSHPEHWSLLE
jgi:hypothetical protein